MKRTIALFLALAMCFLFCSCGEMTLEKRCAKADKLVEKYNKKEIANCTYTGSYEENFAEGDENAYFVVAKVIDQSVDFDTVVETIQKDVSPKLEKVFEGYYATVVIYINGKEDEAQMLLNGKPISDYLKGE